MAKRKVPEAILKLREEYSLKKRGIKVTKRKKAEKPLKVKCYSCGISIVKEKAIPLILAHGQTEPDRLYRCRLCEVGSRRWRKFNKDNEFYQYFKSSEEVENA